MTIPTDLKQRLTSEQTAQALTEAGFPIAGSTLASKRRSGDGPPFELFGQRCIYTWGTALKWAKARLRKAPPPKSADAQPKPSAGGKAAAGRRPRRRNHPEAEVTA